MPTNSASNLASPSSRSISITSRRFRQEHLDHFPEVPLELIEHFALAVRAGEARDVAQHSPVSGSCSTAVKHFMGRILESVVR
jgi:hypothetical protein